jgi:NADPH-dependent 2,4-dienoyl-CoA reductase/sulfur reductase-like enzyme
MSDHRQRFEVVVIGAGPAGLVAASTAAERGKRTALIDETPWLGGQIWRGQQRHPTVPDAARLIGRFQRSGATLLDKTVILGPLEPRVLLAVGGESNYQIEWDQLILATGARELFLPFPGWTLPGNFGPGGLQSLAKHGWPVEGKKVVLAGSGPLLLAVGRGLQKLGAEIISINEQAPWPRVRAFGIKLASRWPGKLIEGASLKWNLRGAKTRYEVWPAAAEGGDRVRSVVLTDGKRQWSEPCDYLAWGFGLVPNVELPLALGCALENGFVKINARQETSVPGIHAAGELCGIGGSDAAIIDGEIAGLAASGEGSIPAHLTQKREAWNDFRLALAQAFALRPELSRLSRPDTIFCRCEDVPMRALNGRDSWRDAKLQTRCGMGACQGRVCGAAASVMWGWKNDSIRPPIFPASVASLARE